VTPAPDPAALLARERALWRQLATVLDAAIDALAVGDLGRLRGALAEQQALTLALRAAGHARAAILARVGAHRLAERVPAATLAALRRDLGAVAGRLAVCERLLALGRHHVAGALDVLAAGLGPAPAHAPAGGHAVQEEA